MIESGDYFFFALGADERATAFRSEIGETNLCGLETNLPRIRRSTTTDAQYRQAISSFAKHPQPSGALLHWVCRDNVAYLDLAEDRPWMPTTRVRDSDSPFLWHLAVLCSARTHAVEALWLVR